MRVEGVTKGTNLLPKTSGTISGGDADEVVCDGHERPVCLDACPGTHKDLAESKVLLDLLMEGFDPEALGIEPRHFEFGHVQIVGDVEAKAVGLFGDEEPHVADLGQADDEGGDPKPFVLGEPNAFESFQSLGQVTDVDFASAREHDTVFSDRRHISPTQSVDEVENLGAGVPGIHEDGQHPAGEKRDGVHQNFDGQLDFAFECFCRARFLGTVAPDGPSPSLAFGFENGRDRTKAFHQSVARMVNADPFDGLAVARAGGIVDGQQRVGLCDLREGSSSQFFLQGLELPGGTCEELMKAVDTSLSKDSGDFPNGAKFDEPDQADQIDEKMDTLRFPKPLQKGVEIGQNAVWGCTPHDGFLPLVWNTTPRDCGRKPCFFL